MDIDTIREYFWDLLRKVPGHELEIYFWGMIVVGIPASIIGLLWVYKGHGKRADREGFLAYAILSLRPYPSDMVFYTVMTCILWPLVIFCAVGEGLFKVALVVIIGPFLVISFAFSKLGDLINYSIERLIGYDEKW